MSSRYVIPSIHLYLHAHLYSDRETCLCSTYVSVSVGVCRRPPFVSSPDPCSLSFLSRVCLQGFKSPLSNQARNVEDGYGMYQYYLKVRLHPCPHNESWKKKLLKCQIT